MAKTITVPDVKWSGAYYPQLLDTLLIYKRANVPELTDESEYEPLIQMIRAFALTGHLSNVLADVVANESTLATARLPQTVRDMLKLIGERLLLASPAQVDALLKLSAPLTADTEVAPDGARFATVRNGTDPAIVFETQDALVVQRTDRVGTVFSVEAGVFTDRTAAARAGTPWTPWATPEAGDFIYVALQDAMWDRLDLTITVPVNGVDGVWEFFDGNLDEGNPDTAVDLGPNLKFVLNGILGNENRAGVTVRVRLSASTVFEDCVSQWDGIDNFITTVALLGQTSPSTDIDAYRVGTEWREIDVINDGTLALSQSGALKFDLPQDVDNDWNKTTVNLVEAFWLRFRIVDVVAPTGPTLSLVKVTEGAQYAIIQASQGESQTEVIGSSDGTADQSFDATKTGYVDGSVVITVDDEVWTSVDNLLNSAPTDKHYVAEVIDDDVLVVTFGDGVNGAIPATGANNIVATYRFGADDNGNVGADTVTIDKSGLTLVNNVTNPRAAVGWVAGEASSDVTLARAKVRAPAAMRTKVLETAVSPDDVQNLSLSYEDPGTASRPFSRALAIEEGFGPKTVELVLVANGGGVPTSDQLTAIETYFNGNKFSSPKKPKRIVQNQEIHGRAYTQRVVDVQATVFGEDTIEPQQIVDALTALIGPEAVRLGTTEYEWDFGGEIPTSRLEAEIFRADPSKVRKVILSAPISNITLGARELPVAGTITILKG